MDIKRRVLETYSNDKTEVEFMKELLTPLFDSMGFSKVVFNHGPGEMGKDYIFCKADEFGNTEYYACLVKRGDIQNTGAGAKNTLAEVERQLGQCFTMPVKVVNGPEIYPSKALVVCSGKISKGAKEQINKAIPSNYNSAHVTYLAADDLIPLMDKNIPYFFEFKLPSIGKYIGSLAERVKKDCSGDSKFSSVLGKIDLTCFRTIPNPLDLNKKQYEECKASELVQPLSTVWVQGGTGSGKTYVAYQYIKKSLDIIREENAGDSQNFKIVFYMKARNIEVPHNFSDLLNEVFKHAKEYYDHLSIEDVEKWIREYHVLFIFDEFEKNANAEIVDKFTNICLEEKLSVSNLIFSRVMGEYQVEFEKRANIFFIKDIKLSDAVDLVRSSIPQDASSSYNCFQDLIRNGVLDRIPRTPLAMNVLSHVFSSDIESSPNNAYEFFDMFFELVLGRWRAGRDLGKSYDYRQIRSFLEHAAYKIVENGELEIPLSELEPIALRILEGVGDSTISAEDYILEICKNSEVVKIQHDNFQFHHRTYLEFLAGCLINAQKWDESFFIENIINPQWEDALIFSAGAKRDCDSLVEKMGAIDEVKIENKFYKLKNVSLVIQALYQSSISSKVCALRSMLETAKSVASDQTFKAIIEKRYPESTDITTALVSLGLFSTFYGRSTLVAPILRYLEGEIEDREKSYLLSALATVELRDEQINLLNDVIKGINLDSGEIEVLALGPFFKASAKMGKVDLNTLKQMSTNKKVKKMNKKIKEISRSDENDFILDKMRGTKGKK